MRGDTRGPVNTMTTSSRLNGGSQEIVPVKRPSKAPLVVGGVTFAVPAALRLWLAAARTSLVGSMGVRWVNSMTAFSTTALVVGTAIAAICVLMTVMSMRSARKRISEQAIAREEMISRGATGLTPEDRGIIQMLGDAAKATDRYGAAMAMEAANTIRAISDKQETFKELRGDQNDQLLSRVNACVDSADEMVNDNARRVLKMLRVYDAARKSPADAGDSMRNAADAMRKCIEDSHAIIKATDRLVGQSTGYIGELDSSNAGTDELIALIDQTNESLGNRG